MKSSEIVVKSKILEDKYLVHLNTFYYEIFTFYRNKIAQLQLFIYMSIYMNSVFLKCFNGFWILFIFIFSFSTMKCNFELLIGQILLSLRVSMMTKSFTYLSHKFKSSSCINTWLFICIIPPVVHTFFTEITCWWTPNTIQSMKIFLSLNRKVKMTITTRI